MKRLKQWLSLLLGIALSLESDTHLHLSDLGQQRTKRMFVHDPAKDEEGVCPWPSRRLPMTQQRTKKVFAHDPVSDQQHPWNRTWNRGGRTAVSNRGTRQANAVRAPLPGLCDVLTCCQVWLNNFGGNDDYRQHLVFLACYLNYFTQQFKRHPLFIKTKLQEENTQFSFH